MRRRPAMGREPTTSLRARLAAVTWSAARAPGGGGELTLTANSFALVASRVVAMGLGFFFWLLAARLFPAAAVGVAAAVVSAMMLCTNVALLGLGSAVIARLPHHREGPAPLLDGALALVTLAAAAGALSFLAVAAVAHDPVYAALFVATSVLGTLGLLLEQTSTALRRGDHALLRGLASGLATVLGLAAIVVLSDGEDSVLLLVPWAAASALVVALGLVQLRSGVRGYRPRPVFTREIARELLRSGLLNHALTLAERAPPLLLPVIVIEVLTPADNATWYAVWMMALIVFIVPTQVGLALFAEVASDAARLRSDVRRAIAAALAVGVPTALAIAALADPLLSLLGSGYADNGVAPLRILVLAILPLTVVQAYFAACRGASRLGEAIATGWASGAAALVAAALAAGAGGLAAMAGAWLAVQCATAAWAALRLRRLRADGSSSPPPRSPTSGSRRAAAMIRLLGSRRA